MEKSTYKSSAFTCANKRCLFEMNQNGRTNLPFFLLNNNLAQQTFNQHIYALRPYLGPGTLGEEEDGDSGDEKQHCKA